MVTQNYEMAKEKYAELGVDTELAIRTLSSIRLTIPCWQGDDVHGFISEQVIGGGIRVTGAYPGAARNAAELKADMQKAFGLVGGKHKVSLHAIYADTDDHVDLNELEPQHFRNWVEWTHEQGLGLDFNPTCFSHANIVDGLTLSSNNKNIRQFWIEHCKRSRKIGEYFGKSLGECCITNLWIPDGFKDTPVDRLGSRSLLIESLDEIYSEKINPKYNIDAIESKLFGIGTESCTIGSYELYMGYAMLHGLILTLDTGHFHLSESIADKISSILLYMKYLSLHISRPVRWDSDHIPILNDSLFELALEIVRGRFLKRVNLGLDYFDASVNRVAAWVIGIRSVQKAFLNALLEPKELLQTAEQEGDFTTRLVILEELKTMPYQAVWDYFCEMNNVPAGYQWLAEVKTYEEKVLSTR